MTNRPEVGSTVRNKLVRLMTHVDLGVKQIAAEFLFVLCKERGRLNSLCPLIFYLSGGIWEIFLLVVPISFYSFQSFLFICSIRGLEEILKINNLKTLSVRFWIHWDMGTEILPNTLTFKLCLCFLYPDFLILMSQDLEPLWKTSLSNSSATILITMQRPGLVPL